MNAGAGIKCKEAGLVWLVLKMILLILLLPLLHTYSIPANIQVQLYTSNKIGLITIFSFGSTLFLSSANEVSTGPI